MDSDVFKKFIDKKMDAIRTILALDGFDNPAKLGAMGAIINASDEKELDRLIALYHLETREVPELPTENLPSIKPGLRPMAPGTR